MDEVLLEDVISVLEDVQDGIDYANETALWDEQLIDSFDVVQIISALNDEFDITIPAKEVVPENFNSAEGLRSMVQGLLDED